MNSTVSKVLSFIKNNYLLIIVVPVILFGYFRIKQLETKLRKQQVESILLIDKEIEELKQNIYKELQHKDSVEYERYLDILDKQKKLKNEYDKINFEYSDIVINRPDF